jgi:hypothetical protein
MKDQILLSYSYHDTVAAVALATLLSEGMGADNLYLSGCTDESLDKGSKEMVRLQTEVAGSKLAMPILSDSYLRSPSCLAVLGMMVTQPMICLPFTHRSIKDDNSKFNSFQLNSPVALNDIQALTAIAATLLTTGMASPLPSTAFKSELKKFLETWHQPLSSEDAVHVMGKNGSYLWPKKDAPHIS